MIMITNSYKQSPFPRRFLRLIKRITPRAISARNNSAPRDTATMTAVESFLLPFTARLLGAEARIVEYVDSVGRKKIKEMI